METAQPALRHGPLCVAMFAVSLSLACSDSRQPPTGPSPIDPHPPMGGQTAVVAIAADIGQCGSPGVARTARVVEGINGPVLLAGDLAYFQGSIQDFIRCFDPQWGQFRPRWHPVPGNHEYETPGAAGYFQYFAEAAGPQGRSFYSLRIGEWLVLMLDSNIAVQAGSEQFNFAREELARHRGPCTLAVWHHPVFSSGPNGGIVFMRDLWRLLNDSSADVLVSGHDHLYERFGKQDANGRSDAAGVRQFVVGTGGADLYNVMRITENSQVRLTTFGVLRLTLHPGRYDWAFIDGDNVVRDSGGDSCH